MAIKKGDELRIVRGKQKGSAGKVFWLGPNKYGPGLRFGLKTPTGETLWTAEKDVEPATGDTTGPVFSRLDTEDMRNPSLGAHVWFTKPPTAKQLEALGAHWAGWRGAREAADCWRFAGRFAEMMFDPKSRDEGVVLMSLENHLRELHTIAPIEKATLFAGSAGAPEPVTIHETFERGVMSVVAGAWEMNAIALQEACSALGLSIKEHAERPPWVGDYPAWAQAWAKEPDAKLRGQPSHPYLLGAAAGPSHRLLTLRPHAALAIGRSEFALRLPDGTNTLIWKAEPKEWVRTAYFLDDDTILALTSKGLRVFTRENGKFKLTAKVVGKGSVMTVHGDWITVCTDVSGYKGNKLRFYVWSKRKLRKIATLKIPFVALMETATERPMVSLKRPEGESVWRWFELQGTEALVEAEHAKKRR